MDKLDQLGAAIEQIAADFPAHDELVKRFTALATIGTASASGNAAAWLRGVLAALAGGAGGAPADLAAAARRALDRIYPAPPVE